MLLAPRFLWGIAVQGTSPKEIPHAIRFARLLAKELDGAVFDPQLDEVWSKSGSRVVAKPVRDEIVTIVELRWWCLRDRVPDDMALRFVAAAQKWLPEAVPTKFDNFGSIRGKFRSQGEQDFQSGWRDPDSEFGIFFDCSAPAVGGSLSRRDSNGRRFIWDMELTVFADPMKARDWRESLGGLFGEVADSLGSFIAIAEVIRGYTWNGKDLHLGYETEQRQTLFQVPQGDPSGPPAWLGLPLRPVWWMWLGEPYAAQAALLPPDRCKATRRGIFYSSSDEPLSWDQLPSATDWIPRSCFAKPLPCPQGVRPAPMGPADWVPEELRKPGEAESADE